MHLFKTKVLQESYTKNFIVTKLPTKMWKSKDRKVGHNGQNGKSNTN